MADWVGDDGSDQYGYLWHGLDHVGGDDWDFDALNENGPDWNAWDDILQPSHPPASTTAPSHHTPIPSSSSTFASPPISRRRSHSRDRLRQRHRSPIPNLPTHRPAGDSVSSPSNTSPRNHSASLPSHPTVRTSSSRGNNISDYITHSRHLHQPNRRARPNSRSHSVGGLLQSALATPSDRSPNPSSSSYSSSAFDGLDIDDLLASDMEEHFNDMAPTERHQRQPRGAVVDLTGDTSPPMSVRDDETRGRQSSRKRPAPTGGPSQDHASKRRRPSPSTTTPAESSNQPIEEVDLTNENLSTEEQLLRSQQQSLIAQQQLSSDTPSGPLQIGKRQCIICMESFTDVTVTHCGHIYCHECLTQALKAGEKNSDRGVGNCPMCRKPVSRKKVNHIVVVSFMRKAAWRGKGRRTLHGTA